MGQTSYAVILILMTVTMATSLVFFAIIFDSYIFNHEVPLPANVNDAFSDMLNGNIWHSILIQNRQLS